MFKSLALAGCAVLLATSLSGCNTLGGIGTPGNSGQFLADLDKFNQAAGKNCSGNGNIDWNPPLPPTGSLHVQCSIGAGQQVIKLSDLQALVAKPGATAAPQN